MPHRLRLFGGWALLGPEGTAIDAVQPRTKAGALLSVLGSRPPGQLVSRAELVRLLWPESHEDRARNSLRVTLSKLRDSLPADALGGRGRERLWLSPSVVESDVRHFETALAEDRFRDALDLYRGPFLEHVHLNGVDAFNRWTEDRRGHFRRRAYTAAIEVGTDALREERYSLAEEAYRKALDLEPFKEEAAGPLMHVLAQQGKRAEAVRLYGLFSERMSDELGLSPSDELEELVDRIRSQPPDSRFRSALPGRSIAEKSSSGETAGLKTAWLPRSLAWVAGLLVVGAAAIGSWLLAAGDQRVSSVGMSGPRIAVLPFEALGGEREENFSRGIHAGLITRLSRVSDLHVVSGTSVRLYEETEKPLPEIANELSARWILEGDVQRMRESVQVNAQLVDVRRNVHVWAESYRRDSLNARNTFEIQAALTRKIVEALEIELGPEAERQVEAVPTENTAAYELYLQARQLDRKSPSTVRQTDREIELYRRALALDPSFAKAWAGLADAFVGRAAQPANSETWADSAYRVARRAAALDPDLAYAYAQIGDALVLLQEPDSAMGAYRKALKIQPDSREPANNLVVLLSRRGELAEKARLLDRLFRTSPRSSGVVSSLVGLNVMLDRDSVADAWRRYARSREISLSEAEFHLALFGRGDADAAEEYLGDLSGDLSEPFLIRRRAALALNRGDWAEARERYRTLYPGPAGVSAPIFGGLLDDRLALAWALERLGQHREARAIAARDLKAATARLERPSPYVFQRLAVARLILGDTVNALNRLEDAVDWGYRSRRTLETVPTLEPLRDHPRFERLLSRMDSLVAEERRRVEAEGWAEAG